MATKTKAATKATATRKGKTAKAATTKATTKAKTAAKAADDGPGKREAAKARDAELTTRMLELREEGNSWSEVAAELNITPGKAQFLNMLHLVAEGDVKPIRFRNDEELTAKCQAARAAADEYSSWGWIAARTGVSEGKIKGLLAEAGTYVPKSENISIVRADKTDPDRASRTTKKGTTTKAAKGKGSTGTTKPASKAAKAKAKAKRKGTTDPS